MVEEVVTLAVSWKPSFLIARNRPLRETPAVDLYRHYDRRA